VSVVHDCRLAGLVPSKAAAVLQEATNVAVILNALRANRTASTA
jgi:cation transport ATPase